MVTEMTVDQKFLAEIRQADTPEKILAIIVNNVDCFGDSYYSDFSKSMLQQAQRVLQEVQDD